MTGKPETWPEMVSRQAQERRELIQNAVIRTGGNRRWAARIIEMPLESMRRFIRDNNLRVPPGKPGRRKDGRQ